jgi:hypothetical protein
VRVLEKWVAWDEDEIDDDELMMGGLEVSLSVWDEGGGTGNLPYHLSSHDVFGVHIRQCKRMEFRNCTVVTCWRKKPRSIILFRIVGFQSSLFYGKAGLFRSIAIRIARYQKRHLQ